MPYFENKIWIIACIAIKETDYNKHYGATFFLNTRVINEIVLLATITKILQMKYVSNLLCVPVNEKKSFVHYVKQQIPCNKPH